MLRLVRCNTLLRAGVRSYAAQANTQDNKMQSLLNAARKGDVEGAEEIAKGMSANRQVNAALASAYLVDQDFEKAREFTKKAQGN